MRKFRRPPIPQLPPLLVNNHWIHDHTEKVELYADHLQQVFIPYFTSSLSIALPERNYCPIKRLYFSPKAVVAVLYKLNVKKALGTDKKIIGRMLLELPRSGILFTRIFNAIPRLGTFSSAWKSAKIIMLPKACKNQSELKSCSPIYLRSVFSKTLKNSYTANT